MRYPKFLKENGTIGFVAPAFGCNMEPYLSAFENAQKKWKAMGYQLDFGPNCYKGEGIGISNTPQLCGEEINDYYTSQENDILISCGGGELMCEDLEYIDFELLKKAEPKWYMGYSDNTHLTYLLATVCDVASIYGPCAAAFGMEPWHESLEDAMGILTGKKSIVKSYPLWEKESLKTPENPLLPYHVTEKSIIKKFLNENVTMSGRLLGGCMDCLVNFLGTKFDETFSFVEKYKEDGIIWFLEACDLHPISIRRAMWQMEHAGWFQYTKGFLIGRPYCMGQEIMGLDQYEAVLGIIGKYNVPVIMDVDIGHIAPMMPIVCGAKAEVKAVGNEIEIAYDFS
ncbi:MAG: LD-carboxypeptidase [Eubacteriales bacterium]